MRTDSSVNELYSIADLADEFGISTRTIRFYDSKGLLEPKRVGTTRVFRRRDRARLALILRGKRLGFTLREISEYLDMYDLDLSQAAQVSLLDQRVGERIAMLERQMHDLETTLGELHDIKRQTEAVLARNPDAAE